MRTYLSLAAVLLFFGYAEVAGHDAWVQTNTQLARVGDAVHVDLLLGNHGNDHRDFKLAGKVDPAGSRLDVISPAGKTYDLMSGLVDLGYAPKEGFHSAKFVGAEAGLYVVAHSSERIVDHGRRQRSLKSAKAMFVLAASLDKPAPNYSGFEKALGHSIEIVPQSNPVLPMGPGQALNVNILLQGQPLAGARVSFIPRGETLAEGFDPRYERMTDTQGRASFTPTTGNYYLVVVHHVTAEAGEGYDGTKYTATLSVLVPELCPCCGES